jgi:hypothetical protein
MSDTIKQAALRYCDKGFSVIPLRPNDKRPLIPWEPYQAKAADAEQIKAWWGKHPHANIGLVTGPVSGVDVVDVDSKEGQDALDTFLPDTLTTPIARTQSGGRHYYFKYRPGLMNRTKVITGCDLRTKGGYVVVPPSKGTNGHRYAWRDSLALMNIEPAPMPDMLFNILQAAPGPSAGPHKHIIDNMHFKGNLEEESISTPRCHANNRQQSTTSDNIIFKQGGRDEALFHLANHLVKGGMPRANIRKYLTFFGQHCTPPFPEQEILNKIRSAEKRATSRDRNLTMEIREWVLTTSGNFLTTDVYSGQHLTTREEKKKATVVLGRLVKDGVIERTGNRNGQFRRVESECEEMDYLNAQSDALNIWLPFALHQLVEIMAGNIIVIAGEPNAGKTGLLLNILRGNQNRFKCHYFSSEMGGGEFGKRLSLFEVPKNTWNFKAYERSSNFADVIKPGEGNLNIIDFLEIHDNFYEMGGRLKEIHDKLKGAVAIIAIQKNRGADTGLGGFRSLEKPRLYLSMAPQTLKIVKAKNWASNRNPNGLQVNFKVRAGCHFTQTQGWHKPAA